MDRSENDSLVKALSLPKWALDSRGDENYKTNCRDERGKFPYYIPFGWRRLGLKVVDKYSDNDWLAENGRPGEWAVAYHGTSKDAIKSIFEEGFRPGRRNERQDNEDDNLNPKSKGDCPKIEAGTYCSPHIQDALDYAKQAGSFVVDGKTYWCVLQVRVNPHIVQICSGRPEYWVCPDKENIRPYGLLIGEESELKKRATEINDVYSNNQEHYKRFLKSSELAENALFMGRGILVGTILGGPMGGIMGGIMAGGMARGILGSLFS